MNKLIKLIIISIFIVGCGKKKVMVDAVVITPTPTVNAELATNTPEPTSLPDDSKIDTEGKEVLEIKEKLFITQINDIFYNFNDYQDKIIVVEGMYSEFTSVDGKSVAPVVFRYGPGCCNNDGWGGFLLRYDGELPKENDWIKVIGTPDLVERGAYKDLYLDVISIEIKTERGAEKVAN